LLTQSPMIANLCLPLQQVTAWNSSHKKHKMPIARLINRLRFQMQKNLFGGRICWDAKACRILVSCLLPDTYVHRPVFSRNSGVLNQSQEVNTMLQNNSQALNSEQNTLDKLNQSFINVCFAYADLNAYLSKADLEISPCRFVWITSEIANLSEELEALRTGGAK